MLDSVSSPYIHVANAAKFQTLVMDNSQRGPVLVSFWSHKAGPCSILEPEPRYQQNYPQLAMLRIIKLLGHEHPRIGQYRSQIQRYAY